MKNKQPLFIAVPNPCAEDWNKMKPREQGRFCNNCRQTVIDFTGLSDTELYHYFKNRKTIPCGRFHTSQLNKPLYPVEHKKNRWRILSRPIAAALALLTIKDSSAALLNKAISTSLTPSPAPAAVPAEEGDPIISGVIKNNKGETIASATVTFNDSVVAVSDKNGYFEFIWKEKKAGSYTLYFSFPGMATLVRQYHTAMLSTSYNIILSDPYTGENYTRVLGGVPVITTTDLPWHTLKFSSAEKKPGKVIKEKLASLAIWMRNHPGVIIQLNTNSNFISLNKQRQLAVKEYLVAEEGISSDRFILQVNNIKAAGMEHTIEIIVAE